MRLVTFDSGDGPRAGLLAGEMVTEVGDDLLDLVRAGLDTEPAARAEPVGLPGVRLLTPIARPGKIVCIGLNYRAHAAEAGLEPPEAPTFFAKFANALAHPGAEVPFPAASKRVDYEAEVAFVVSRTAKNVGEEEAPAYIAGYTLLNDLSARDLQFQTPQWGPGKVFDGSAPCGPALVTPDEAGPADEIEIELTLNGEVMQSASTSDLVFSIPALLSRLSHLMTLEPGDIVSTGTPAGVGSTRDPGVWLKPGDEIVITSPQLGKLVTTIGEPA